MMLISSRIFLVIKKENKSKIYKESLTFTDYYVNLKLIKVGRVNWVHDFLILLTRENIRYKVQSVFWIG